MTRYKLKPCPFCGAAADFECGTDSIIHVKTVRVRCSGCKARSDLVAISLNYAAKEKAAQLWNERADDDAD